MKRRIKKILAVFIWTVATLVGWTAYVAYEGYFYFSPATPLCEGQIGAIAVSKQSIEVCNVGSGCRAFTLWCESIGTLTNTAASQYTLSRNGEIWCQFDFKVRPLWLLWQNTGTTDESDSGRRFALPCVWPYHYLALRLFMADLAKPTIITGATVTEVGTYSLGPRVVFGTNGVVQGAVWPPVLVQSTTNAYEGSADLFGLRYVIEGHCHERSAPLLVKRWIHPPIPDPRTGKIRTQTDDEQVSAALQQYSYMRLRDSRYLVPGVWTFQLLHNETILCQQPFVIATTNTSIAIRSTYQSLEPSDRASGAPVEQTAAQATY